MSDNKTIAPGLNVNYFAAYHPSQLFIFDACKKTDYTGFLVENRLDREIVKDADKICAHIFNLLGSGDRYLGDKIKWNEDFKTSFAWENKYFKDIAIIDLTNPSDVKVPWELSRFQHIFTLGKAYWLMNDEKYALEFKAQIEDWVKNNPYEHSVNWFCAMDVAIRAVNWITGFYFFKESSLDDDFWKSFHKALYLHGTFIFDHLENIGGFTSNHYLSDVVGLIWLGLYFKNLDFKWREDNHQALWLEYGLKELESEIFIQVNGDGPCYEDSTSYHRLDCELFLLTTILCGKNGIHFSKAYGMRLEKMFEFIADILKPDGLAPFIGDADDGRFVIFSHYSGWVRKDFRHILAVAGEYFDRDLFRHHGNRYKEDAMWTVGAAKDGAANLKPASRGYDQSGYYILRNDQAYCVIKSGELSFHGLGGHSHNDRLSFELNVDGKDFFIDPGVYVYTADVEMRNVFRSTKVHNTLHIEGYEQNDFTPEPFELIEQTFARCTLFTENSFCGRHEGYKEKCGVVHERQLEMGPGHMVVRDRLIGNLLPEAKVCRNFSLHQDVTVEITSDGFILYNQGKTVVLKTEDPVKINLVTAYVSESYGAIADTKRIELVNQSSCPEMKVDIYFPLQAGEGCVEKSMTTDAMPQGFEIAEKPAR